MSDDRQLSEKRLLDEILIRYENEPWLRAIVQAVPLAGSSADTLLAWRAVYLSKERTKELFRNLSERLSHIEDSALNKEFLQSENFFELLQSCVEIVVRTASEYKRRYVASFLAGTIKQGHSHNLSQQIAEDIKVLQDIHLQILLLLPNESSKEVKLHALREAAGFAEWGPFNKCISDLQRLGFLRFEGIGITFGGEIKICQTTGYLAIFKESLAA